MLLLCWMVDLLSRTRLTHPTFASYCRVAPEGHFADWTTGAHHLTTTLGRHWDS
ncbi:hypothetical protein PR003_g7775 [Phytophthora rubi]|uniref:Uncharacterized protein n=1 Tax=Phytophthora rubi TaxID=129364 RepID=A0A6A3N5L2_9STRA|nr:hypothetical protein PR001_g7446 [Phytophthora rubi]KAE9345770.1 hypothetical protein PR003_g7775 [Phytophthora rubi]